MVHDQVLELADISDSQDLSIAQGTSHTLYYSWRLLKSHVGIKYIVPIGSSGGKTAWEEE